MHLNSHRVLLLAYFGATVLVALIFRSRKTNHTEICKYLNCIAACLCALAVFSFIEWPVGQISHSVKAQSIFEPLRDISAVPAAGEKQRPNIYYVILDAYANDSSLSKVYGYDNSPFTLMLRERGFIVVKPGMSNYAYTSLSLASSLNMQYLDKVVWNAGDKVGAESALSGLISDNAVARLLKKEGYEYVFFDSGWAVTRESSVADEVIHFGGMSEIDNVFVRTTMLNPFVRGLGVEGVRSHVLGAFEKLRSIGEGRRRPLFVFAHIVSPHPPFVFEASGAIPSTGGVKMAAADVVRRRFNEAYISQLCFINGKVAELIDVLLAREGGHAIIIIQADHGPAFPSDLEIVPSVEIVEERMGILNAIYLPKECKCNLYVGMTPVNTFRAVFDGCFGAEYKMLEDRSYYSTMDAPFKFLDVGDRWLGNRR